MCKSNKTIIVELCNKSKMPTNGWIQACLTCDNFTSRLFDYMVVTKKNKTIDYKAYLCKDCDRIINKDEVAYFKFLDTCEIHMKKGKKIF